ncbi:DUF4082 domain-containing protein, partial [Klebsiella pneumoniae]|uniref:DUF4082 domain-containing protein n=1 Tax=Klebsiella pneumoniae TaxID=573 RepID=UPI001D0ED072
MWTASGEKLATASYGGETREGWQEATLDVAVQVRANSDYIASYRAPRGRYAADTGALSPSTPKRSYDLIATESLYS